MNGFVELIVQTGISATSSIVATNNTGIFTADIHNGVDEDTITAVLKAMKNA